MNIFLCALISVIILSFSNYSLAVDKAPTFESTVEVEQPQQTQPIQDIKKQQGKKSSRYSNMRRRLAMLLILKQPM